MSKPSPVIKEIERAAGRWPEMLALVNGFNNTAYQMKWKGVKKVSSTEKIGDAGQALILDYTISSNVCDSHYIKDFSVRLDNVLESYAKRLWKSELVFSVDNEVLLKSPLKDLLKKKLIPLPAFDTKCLYYAADLDANGDAITNSRIGYMPVNTSILRVKLQNIPPGKGTVKIEMDLALYTTKKESI
jgi:hypothetical protein